MHAISASRRLAGATLAVGLLAGALGLTAPQADASSAIGLRGRTLIVEGSAASEKLARRLRAGAPDKLEVDAGQRLGRLQDRARQGQAHPREGGRPRARCDRPLGRRRSRDDALIGGAGADTLLGAAGDDVLLGGPGVDTLDAGPGNNIVIQD
jgi:Ca2+-binding RTX toxin-like protein